MAQVRVSQPSETYICSWVQCQVALRLISYHIISYHIWFCGISFMWWCCTYNCAEYTKPVTIQHIVAAHGTPCLKCCWHQFDSPHCTKEVQIQISFHLSILGSLTETAYETSYIIFSRTWYIFLGLQFKPDQTRPDQTRPEYCGWPFCSLEITWRIVVDRLVCLAVYPLSHVSKV
jgi:hypothetical protein